MESKSLHAIQTIAKVGKVLSTVAYIGCLVGGVCCVVGIICVGVPWSMKVGTITLHPMIDNVAGVDLGTCYAAMASGIAFCAAGCVTGKLGQRYFANELAAGTPFTIEGARELMRLGICTAVAPIAALAVAEIWRAMIGRYFVSVADLHIDPSASFMIGIAFIVASLICRYGAEVNTVSKAEC